MTNERTIIYGTNVPNMTPLKGLKGKIKFFCTPVPGTKSMRTMVAKI